MEPAPPSSRKSRASSGRAVYSSNMPDELEFEKPLLELENRIAELRASEDSLAARDEIAKLEERLARQQQRVYVGPDRLAAHAARPPPEAPPHPRLRQLLLRRTSSSCTATAASATTRRSSAASPRFDGEPVVVIGHQKGRDTKENIARNFGMPHPEGYRKALRLMQLGRQVRPADHHASSTRRARIPGLGAEERGQAEAIARNLREMAGLRAPMICGRDRRGRQRRRARARRRQPRPDARVRDLLGDLARGLRGDPVARCGEGPRGRRADASPRRTCSSSASSTRSCPSRWAARTATGTRPRPACGRRCASSSGSSARSPRRS